MNLYGEPECRYYENPDIPSYRRSSWKTEGTSHITLKVTHGLTHEKQKVLIIKIQIGLL